jgi:ABC-type proline/glycine betaine transport system substrate-binding protein
MGVVSLAITMIQANTAIMLIVRVIIHALQLHVLTITARSVVMILGMSFVMVNYVQMIQCVFQTLALIVYVLYVVIH